MRQRLGIADALVKSPDLLILDEPTTSIDPLGVVEILDLLRRLVDERGLAILLSSHLLSQVQSVCDRIGIFAAGRLVGIGTVEELARTFGDGTAVIEVGLELPTAADVERAGHDPGRAPVGRVGRASDATAEAPGASTSARPTRRDASARTSSSPQSTQGLRLTALRPIVPSLDDIYRIAVERPSRKSKGTPSRRGASRRSTRAAERAEARASNADWSTRPVEAPAEDEA